MATIKPFNAIRPAADKAKEIAALPYDVYNRKEAAEVVKNNPGSFLAIDRAETAFDPSVDMYSDEVYQKAHDLLWQWVDEGRFITDDKDCYYVYEQIMDGRHQTGIVALASIDDYANGVIKKHENTRAEKEADRIRHVDETNAQTGPIFLAYRAVDTIKKIVESTKKRTPVYDILAEDGIAHKVWIISDDNDIDVIKSEFNKMNAIYIADGHHRAASAVKVGQKRRAAKANYTGEEEFNFFLSVLFPDDELRIYDYNRVVKDLNGLSSDELKAQIAGSADVIRTSTEEIRPETKGQFSMFLDGEWTLYQFKASVQSSDPVEGLDVSLLQNNVLAPILGIADPKTDSRIDFVGGIRGLGELVKRCNEDCKVAFAMYPTSISELFDVADASLLMPPKSTWFEPKLRSGLFIHKLDY